MDRKWDDVGRDDFGILCRSWSKTRHGGLRHQEQIEEDK
jgi:hypothetical protein